MEPIERKGIIAGGNWIVDFVKLIDVFPQENTLANILAEKMGNGGAPYNVLKALSKMQAPIPLEGIGIVGNDDVGRQVLNDCINLGIDVKQLKQSSTHATSFTDVMTVVATGNRTFFHHRGANSLLTTSDFDLSHTNAKIFHLGYLLLLDGLDLIDESGLSEASKVLKAAIQNGLLTSVDLVSEESDRYTSVVPSSIPYIDILFLNEFEASRLTGINIIKEPDNGVYNEHAVMEVAEIIIRMGIRKWIIIHFPQGALAINTYKEVYFQPSLQIPQDSIKGTVGAGDAFAAGVLAAIHEAWSIQDALRSGVCVAASCLLAHNASDGILKWNECLSLSQRWNYR